jgi:hypothetical protein
LNPGESTIETGGPRNLADLILAKIAEQDAGNTSGQVSDGSVPAELPLKVVEVYSK